MRVSSNQMSNDLQYYMEIRDRQLSEWTTKMGSQQKHNNLGENPVESAHSSRYLSKIQHLKKYIDNASFAESRFDQAEGYISQVVEDLQSIRELAVQGANGTNTGSDLQQIGRMVNGLLADLVSLANSSDEYGSFLFAGTASKQAPFVVLTGRAEGLSEGAIIDVQYNGDIGKKNIEINDGIYTNVNFPGNELFWAEHQRISAAISAQAGYQVPTNTDIYIDGQAISLEAGDNMLSIVKKINQSNVAVKASLTPVTDSIMLETTVPHQIWLEEGADTNVLASLGLISETESAPNNLSPTATSGGGSLFDVVINLRDALMRGDHSSIGSRNLQAIDNALSSVITRRTELGEAERRTMSVRDTSDVQRINYISMDAKENSLDMSEAIIEFKKLQLIQNAIYQITAQNRRSLMDFLS